MAFGYPRPTPPSLRVCGPERGCRRGEDSTQPSGPPGQLTHVIVDKPVDNMWVYVEKGAFPLKVTALPTFAPPAGPGLHDDLDASARATKGAAPGSPFPVRLV
jgi:hypothetical protein